jgi:hypothetical protein
MNPIKILLVIVTLQPVFGASAEEHGRIKKKPPTAVEAERIASEMVRNDGSLQNGDIVATDRGFFVFRGLAPGRRQRIRVSPKYPVIRLIATICVRLILIEANKLIGRALSTQKLVGA